MASRGFPVVEMVGRTLGKLTVLRRVPNLLRNARWLCRCECGREEIFTGVVLRQLEKRGPVHRLACSHCSVRAAGLEPVD